MKLNFEFDGERYQCLSEDGTNIAIPMDFDGQQPNHFGAPKAIQSTLELNGFVGDTEKGGSCNVESLTMIPHCNGTHTETISHIVDAEIPISEKHIDSFSTATLISVEPEPLESIRGRGESYRPPLEEADWVICAAQLEFAFHSLAIDGTASLIIRTINSIDKRNAAYGEETVPPFFTVEAIELINKRNYRHLLVDFPSVDRMYDDGLLTNHHLFWNVEEETHRMTKDCWSEKTITEMVLIPDGIEDGLYLLNMQVPAFQTDAAPSRPIVFKPKKVQG